MAAATLKLNIANPSTGAQIKLDLEDDKQRRIFMDKRISQEVEGDALGSEWKGYIFKIMGGNDKEGFPMMQGVLLNKRVRLLLNKDSKCYRQRRTGERKRKSIRGCIVAPDISVLHLVVVKKGPEDFPGLTDKVIPRRLGPKRASKIRKLFNLSKQDDVRQYVIRREIAKEGKKKQFKAPKIQRLVTPRVLQRKRRRLAEKKKRYSAQKQAKADYLKLLAQRNKQKRESVLSKKRSESTKGSIKDGKSATAAATKKPAATKAATKAGTKAATKAGTKAPAKGGAKVAAKAPKTQAKAPGKATAKKSTAKASGSGKKKN